jgi:hypothetical protein
MVSRLNDMLEGVYMSCFLTTADESPAVVLCLR